jgi:hypothetical protein
MSVIVGGGERTRRIGFLARLFPLVVRREKEPSEMKRIGLKALAAVLTIGRRSRKHLDWTLLVTISSTIVTFSLIALYVGNAVEVYRRVLPRFVLRQKGQSQDRKSTGFGSSFPAGRYARKDKLSHPQELSKPWIRRLRN